jgi:hypothetical protein
MEYLFNLVRSSVNKCVKPDILLRLCDLADRLRQITGSAPRAEANLKQMN